MNRLKYLLVFALVCFVFGCGGSNNPPPVQIAVSISPNSASIEVDETQQFTATVSGTSNTAVTWSATCGTVSSDGLYRAPVTTDTITCTVTARSQADTTKSASAKVTVTAPSKTVSVTCLPALISRIQNSQCSVRGIEGAVSWFVESIQGGDAKVGTITSAGLYAPPETVFGQMTVRVKAESVSDPASYNLTSVTVMFEWVQFYSPYSESTGEATAIALNPDSSRLVAAYSSSIADSTEKTAGLLLYDATTGEQNDVWTNSPIPSRINDLVLSPDGNVYAAGFTGGDDAHPEERAAWLVKASVGDTLEVLFSKDFQLEDMKTEARAVSIQNGKIYLAVKSAFEKCGYWNVCSGDWIVVLDLEGNIISKLIDGGFRSSEYTSITDLWMGSDHYWAVGNRFKLIDGKLQPDGIYGEREMIDDKPGAGAYMVDPLGHFDPKLAGEFGGHVFYGSTRTVEFTANASKQEFMADEKDQEGVWVSRYGFSWNGDNAGPVSVNTLKDILLDSAGRLIAVGSLSKLDSADPNVTDAGVISWKTDNLTGPREVVWKNRFDAVPGGSVSVFNAAVTTDSRGGVFFAGAGLNNETVCGSTPCLTPVVMKFTPPIP